MTHPSLDPWEARIDEFVRTIAYGAGTLVAAAAISGGKRRPINWTIDAFFLGISEHLEGHGVSRKVGADMLGISRRTYQRQLDNARHQGAVRRRSDWLRVLDSLIERNATREELGMRLKGIAPDVLASLIRDLTASQLVNEHEGILSVRRPSQAMDTEEQQRFVAVLRRFVPEVKLTQLAALLNVSESEAQALWETPIAHAWVADDQSVWPLMNATLTRVHWFLHGRIRGDRENHRGGFFNMSLDGQTAEAHESLRAAVRKATQELVDTTGALADPQKLYPTGRVREWSAVILENADVTFDHGDVESDR